MRIGELLIRDGHLTQDGLEEALDWQVLYGGRLGTNLLELRLVQEEHLARALGKQLGCEVAWGDLQIDPALVQLVPKHVADRQELVPWKMERRRLKLLVTEIHPEKIDELAYKLGRPVAPVVAPEFRVIGLLRGHYKATRQMRALDFGVVPEQGRRRKKKSSSTEATGSAPELIDEAEFNEIYNRVLEGRGLASDRGSSEPATRGGVDKVDTPPPNVGHAPEGTGAVAARSAAIERPPAAVPAAPVAPPAVIPSARPITPLSPAPGAAPPAFAPPPPEAIEALPEDAILGELPAGGAASASPAAPSTWEEPPPPAPPVNDAPIDFQEALHLLAGVRDRDAIAHIVLRASRSKAARALLLQVQGGVALGWDGLGEGLENGAARTVAVPLAAPSAFQLVVKTRSHFMGALHKTPINVRFLAQLGKKVPLSSLLLPVLVRGRVSHLLYLDNGHKRQAPTDVGEMLILSQRIAQSVEALVDRRRATRR